MSGRTPTDTEVLSAPRDEAWATRFASGRTSAENRPSDPVVPDASSTPAASRMLTCWPATGGSTVATNVTLSWNATFFEDAVKVRAAVVRAEAAVDRATRIANDASTAVALRRADMSHHRTRRVGDRRPER